MFMASNQFKVIKGREEAFESAWMATSARLREAPGLIGFRFDKGKELGEHILYFSITMWETETCFLDWKYTEGFGAGLEMPGSARRRLAPPRREELDTMISKNNPQ